MLSRALKTLKIELGDAQVNDMIDLFDCAGTGGLSQADFFSIMKLVQGTAP